MNVGTSAPAIGFCVEVLLLAAVLFGNGAAAVDEEHVGKSGILQKHAIIVRSRRKKYIRKS